jgi:ribosomal protein L10
MTNSIAVLFTTDDGIAALKVIEKYKKEWKKEKAPTKMSYL